jgi:hypothetical protein
MKDVPLQNSNSVTAGGLVLPATGGPNPVQSRERACRSNEAGSYTNSRSSQVKAVRQGGNVNVLPVLAGETR